MKNQKLTFVGNHAVSNSCITEDWFDETMENIDAAQVFYSDPPWGDGNLKYWATMNKKQTGEVYNPISYQRLISRIMEIVDQHVVGHVFIETGLRWEDDLRDLMTQHLNAVKSFHIKYNSGKNTNVLIYGCTKGITPVDLNPSGMSGYKLVKFCVSQVSVPGGILIDPCCGKGYSARAAIEHGMIFRGNEFNSARLSKTIERLEKSL